MVIYGKVCTELLNRLGEVRHVECYAQGTAVAVVWGALSIGDEGTNEGVVMPVAAIFSSFGSQLWCSLESTSDRWLSFFIVRIVPKVFHHFQ